MKESSPTPPTAAPKRILVVDDAANVAETIQDILSHFGHHVETSHGGDEALRKLASACYDLVITDYAMPKMNGIELARAIKERSASLPVMLVSGFVFSISAKYSPPLPVDAVLAKPFSLKQLHEAIDRFFPSAGEAFAE